MSHSEILQLVFVSFHFRFFPKIKREEWSRSNSDDESSIYESVGWWDESLFSHKLCSSKPGNVVIVLQWSDMKKMGDSPISCCLPLPFRKMSHMNYFLRSFKWDTFKVHSSEVATVKNIENSVCNAGVKNPVTKAGHRNVCCQSLNAVIWNNPQGRHPCLPLYCPHPLPSLW